MSIVQGKTDVLKPTQYDMQMMLACGVHHGTKNLDKSMEKYIWKRREDGIHLINLGKTWEKLMLAARIIVAIENPKDVVTIASSEYGQRAILKYSTYTGSQYVAGRFTPGMFTNQIQDRFIEPRLLIVTDPLADHQAIKEASYANIPVIAFCDTDCPVNLIDVAIPSNNKGRHSIGLMYWLLAREVLRLRDSISRRRPWEVKVDLFFYREPEEAEKAVQKEYQGEEGQAVRAYESTVVTTEQFEYEEEDEAFEPLTNQENAQILSKQTSDFFST
jgi:small subunit ribosomal protein SAe